MANQFREGLQSGAFQVVARVMPPKSADLSSTVGLVSSWKGKVQSILVPDNPHAVMGVSSLAVAERLKREGHDVIVTVSCRDRNRLALGSTVLGAAALNVESILCVSGDYFHFGDHPEAKPVYDLDSVQLISMLREMGNGKDVAGNPMDDSPSFFLGGAVCAGADPSLPQVMKARKKIAAGADFFITLPIFGIEGLELFLEDLSDLPVKVLAGVLLPSYQEIVRYEDGSIPGTFIPEDLVNQWKSEGEDGFHASSADLVKGLISELKDSGKVAGVCISASGRESEIEGLL